MRYVMNVVREGKELKWAYDNEDNSVYDEHGNCLNPFPLFTTDANNAKPFTKDYNPNVKTSDSVRTLHVMLGFNCNLNCAYCEEEKYKDRVHHSTPKDVEGIIAKLHKADFKNIISIEIWGGEPFVYWKTYKLLIPELRKLYPDAHISTFTNGVLLDKEKVDFFKEYSVSVTVSYDSVHSNANKLNTKYNSILDNEDICDTLRYFHEVAPELISFWATLIPRQVDFKEIEDNVKRKLKLDNINIDYLPIKCVSINDTFTRQEYEKVLEQYYDCLMNNLPSASTFAHEHLFTTRILTKANRLSATSHCTVGFTGSIAFTLDGSVYNCYIRPTKVGTLDNIKQTCVTGLTHWTEHEYCSRCPFIQCCGGICYTIPKERHRYTCNNFRAYVEAFFRACIAKTFGVYVKNVEYEDTIFEELAEEKQKVITIVPTK